MTNIDTQETDYSVYSMHNVCRAASQWPLHW